MPPKSIIQRVTRDFSFLQGRSIHRPELVLPYLTVDEWLAVGLVEESKTGICSRAPREVEEEEQHGSLK